MPVITGSTWSTADYCLAAQDELAGSGLSNLAHEVYRRVCRCGFDAPGFCLIDLGTATDSESLRRTMVSLKQGLCRIHQATNGRELIYLSAGRFDQQITTKLHRDGGPEESFLMLGYEPSSVPSEVALADYSKCAYDLELTPQEFLEKHNPMFAAGEQLLQPYTTTVRCFSHQRFQILLINNSIAPFSTQGETWQGVLHTATVREPSDNLRRVVNSTMVASVSIGTAEPITEVEQHQFITSTIVRRRGYDKPQLNDDP